MDARRLTDACILVVDDEPANVQLLEKHLALSGYTRVLGTTRSVEVVALVEREKPDLILLDLHMPSPDGLQIMAQLRARLGGEYLPILVLTADVTPETRQAALSGGARDFLSKPFDWAEVLLRIRNLLETRALYEQLREQKALLEDQLQHAQRMEVVGRLTGGIAHDFNNVLTVIHGNADLMLLDIPPGEERLQEDVREIKSAAERAAGLTRRLLAFTRQERREPSLLDVNRTVVEMEKMLRRLLGGGIRLVLDLDPSLGRVVIDAGQFQQVILNLAINAGDAMPRGGTLRFATRDTVLTEKDRRRLSFILPGRYVQLQITDTGIGMDAATLDRLFTPYFTTKEAGKGTGLGLSIVYGIAKQNRGYVWAESELGAGTTFTFSLPLAGESAAPRPLDVAPVEVHHGTGTVVTVEPDEAVRAVMRKVLLRSGYRVIETHDAAEALLFCEEYRGRVDLVVADFALPAVRDGTLADQLLSSRQETRLLLVSAYADGEPHELAQASSRIGFLPKPFATGSFAHAVKALVDAG